MVAVKVSSKHLLPGCPAIASDSHVQFQLEKPPVTTSNPDKQRPPSLSMARNASTATIHNEEQIVHHTKHCKADVCLPAHVAKCPTPVPAPPTPSPPPACNAQQAQHAQRAHRAHVSPKLQRNENASAASATCNSSNKGLQQHGTSLSDTQQRREVRTADANCHQEVREKLLWWPVDHIQTQHGRLAVGNSCYIITGQCVLCGIDDELDMVECTGCKRFTHFYCTVPKLEKAPVGDFFCHLCRHGNPAPSVSTAQPMVDAGSPGVGVLWVTFIYTEMDKGQWESQDTWMQGYIYSKKADSSNELILSSEIANWMSPEAVLGICPVDNHLASASSTKGSMHYSCKFTEKGSSVIWDQLLVEMSIGQYSDLYGERPPNEMEQFTHSFRLPHPEIYKAMLGVTGQSMPKRKLDSETDRATKKQKTGHAFLQRVRSLVKPLQVEVVSRALEASSPAVTIHRYMASGSCIGIEVWQRAGLLGQELEQGLTDLVNSWQIKDASIYPNTIVDSSVAKRRKVYFGCRDIHEDPELHWDVEPVPTVITSKLVPRLMQLGVITSASDVHQAVLNIYHKGGYLVAHHDSEAHYQQPVLMIQIRSDSALSFGYKAGGWAHCNEDLRFIRIAKPLFSMTVLKNEAFSVLKHCVCSRDTQSGRCATLVLRNITPCQRP